MSSHRRNHLNPLLVLSLVVAVMIGLQPQIVINSAAAAEDCDCSCEAFRAFKSRMEEFNEEAKSRKGMGMMPGLDCARQCIMQWNQCEQERTAGPAGDANRRSRPSAGAGTASGTAAPQAQTRKADAPYPLGEPRDDLERFYGVYGDGSGRNFFVAEAEREYPTPDNEIPPGYLMIGAMWGDVAPWYMKSVAETRFKQQWTSSKPIVARFKVDGDGNAEALVFETVFKNRGELERLRDLPEDW